MIASGTGGQLPPESLRYDAESIRAASSISRLVLPRPIPNRTARRASDSVRPIAVKTWLGRSSAVLQALPLLNATSGVAAIHAEPSMSGRVRLRFPGRRRSESGGGPLSRSPSIAW